MSPHREKKTVLPPSTDYPSREMIRDKTELYYAIHETRWERKLRKLLDVYGRLLAGATRRYHFAPPRPAETIMPIRRKHRGN